MLINIIMYIIALSKSSKIAMSFMLYKYFAKIQLISYYNKYYIISLLIFIINFYCRIYFPNFIIKQHSALKVT